ncbi:BTB/POZ and MATH domain-containing protein 2 [Rhynchospora pubera]|uniref:BTB/POZ and MATH domain-containing protein 2 n=1 Tax=Rhynchospora pubera TaxID=906938 RepID=A0AAV8GYW6_9POAL|nr:BTB/POZ and MATH domain-containing protein 2 [Rhynchospora pubera]KAJ4807989.1 BTB/POZ and MATH domain-containing protein 2 [Rhynchospora pubera]KAJ4807993.1 BTB/POZ and MATH domain-containing protein 2 [Rhynchospora pubera]
MEPQASSFECPIVFEYSNSTKLLPVGQSVSSTPFLVGCCYWIVDFYPNGSKPNENAKATYASLYLSIHSEMKGVCTEFSFSVRGNDGKFVQVRKPVRHTFSKLPAESRSFGFPDFLRIEKIQSQEDKFFVMVRVKVLSSPILSCEPDTHWLQHNFKNLWETGQGSDIEIQVDGDTMHAHKLILAAGSSVFRAEFYGPLANPELHVTKPKEVKAEVLRALVRFAYTGNFDISKANLLPYNLVQELLVAADRYDMANLILKCQRRLWVGLSLDNVLSSLGLAVSLNLGWLREKCVEFLCEPEILRRVIGRQEYCSLVIQFPALGVEVEQRCEVSFESEYKISKKQRTG